MSNYKDDLFCKVKNKLKEKKKHIQHANKNMYSDEEVGEPISESQDFCLKLTPDSAISDSQGIISNDDKDVIVISDSSSDCCSPKSSSNLKFKSNKCFSSKHEVQFIDSSNTESSDIQEQHILDSWKKNNKSNIISNYKKENNFIKKNNPLFTSDDTTSTNSESNEKYIESSIKTKSTYFSFTPENMKASSNYNSQLHNNVNGKNVLSPYVSNNTNSKSTNEFLTTISNKTHDIKKLTRKDAQTIIKNIKSTRLVYESPRRENNVIINESIDNGMHPAISSKSNLKENTKIIDETPGSSESDVVQDSQKNLKNVYKNHISKTVHTLHVDKNTNTMCTELSDRKKKQIAEWLMTNTPDSKSDSSFGIVPASNKSDISSGNSSLERLEMNYETPNNRERIRQAQSGKKITNEECKKIGQPSAIRQTTLLEYTKRSKNNILELRTATKNFANNMISTPTINEPQNINVMDCADILDKLYGNLWRNKADELLPKSEPRKQIVSTKNRAVQTERKIKMKKVVYSSDSEDEDSSTSLKDLKSQKPIEKKNIHMNIKKKDSFINDETSSESECESSYYTALTNPRGSTNNTKPKPTFPSHVQKVVELCDTDSESEDKDEDNNCDKIQDLRRKKLSFSEDESESSSTSEFDPGDEVPLKPISKKVSPKFSRQILKKGTIFKSSSDARKYEKRASFLASLSENIPLANAHPDAKKYRTDYKTNKEALCNYLYKLYSEKVFNNQLPEDMSIEWNVRMRGTAGFCYNKRSIKTLGGVVRTSRIVLSTKVLDTPDRLRDTLIHEMCHAAAWLINEVSDGHGPFWTGWANKAMKIFPDLPPIRRCHDYKIKTKFTYRCVGCGYSIGRHSKSLDVERKRCGHCYGKFELLLNKTTKSGTVQVQTPKRELGGFALYVKENYNSVKKERNVRHAEVMKILGQQFSAIKIARNQGTSENNLDTPG